MSVYEQHRLANIERNNKCLEELGLLTNADKKPKQQRTTRQSGLRTRTRPLSSRLAQKPIVVGELSDELLAAEERLSRSRRPRKKKQQSQKIRPELQLVPQERRFTESPFADVPPLFADDLKARDRHSVVMCDSLTCE